MFKNKWRKLSSFRKKAFAAALSVAVASSTLNVGSYIVNADTSVNGRVITSFEELPEDISYQYLPVGSKKKDIVFPDELKVTLYSDEETGEEGSTEESKEREEEASTWGTPTTPDSTKNCVRREALSQDGTSTPVWRSSSTRFTRDSRATSVPRRQNIRLLN